MFQDSNGEVEVNFEKIENKYGSSKDLDLVKENFYKVKETGSSNVMARSGVNDFFDCMTFGLAGTIAGNKIGALYSVKGTLLGLLKAKSWKAAAGLIISTTGTAASAPVIVSILSGAAIGCGLNSIFG